MAEIQERNDKAYREVQRDRIYVVVRMVRNALAIAFGAGAVGLTVGRSSGALPGVIIAALIVTIFTASWAPWTG